ncbi:MAG: diguanylate cyclase domain-containing protein [Stenotrophomonas sp.]
MSATAEQYFPLVVPATSLLLGLALLAGWRSLRDHRYLLWLAGGYICTVFPLAAQILMDNARMATWSVLTGAMYCAGSWATAQGFALRSGGRVSGPAALAISLITLLALFCFSRLDDVLGTRIVFLNLGMGLLLALALPVLFDSEQPDTLFERLLRRTYLLLVAYAILRPLLAWLLAGWFTSSGLPRSGLWLWMLAFNLLLNLWLLFLLLGGLAQQLMGELRHERNHDPLTQLLNRRAFFEIANHRLQHDPARPWALLACDVDHFKQVNDTWGHAAGDNVLRQVGVLLQQMTRPDDLVARFGGEEFVLLVHCHDLPTAARIAERIRVGLSQMHCSPAKQSITASFGVTMVATAQDLESALERADLAVYQAKHEGRNRLILSPSQDGTDCMLPDQQATP